MSTEPELEITGPAVAMIELDDVPAGLLSLDALAKEGFDPTFGARPLKRLIQRKIQNPLAVMILDGRFADGDLVRASLSKKGEIEFSKK